MTISTNDERWCEKCVCRKKCKAYEETHKGSLMEELELYKKALEKSCLLLSMSNDCFNGYCPLDKTITDKWNGFECKHCPDCGDENVWQEYFLQKAREE